MFWLEGVPVNSSVDIIMYEHIEDGGATFCHGHATMNPWSLGVQEMADARSVRGTWLDVVVKTKSAHDRGPVMKITMAINHMGGPGVQASGGPSVQASGGQSVVSPWASQATYEPSAPHGWGVEQAFSGIEEASIDSNESFQMQSLPKPTPATTTNCIFYIDPVMKKYQHNLWPDTLSAERVAGLPNGPLRNYNIMAMGFDWEAMKYNPSGIGAGVPATAYAKDLCVSLCTTTKHHFS